LKYCCLPTKVLIWSLLLVLCCTVGKANSSEKSIQIIANPNVGVDQLDTDQIKRIFTMYQTNWPNSQPIVVFVMASQHATHQLFSREVLGLFPYQLDRIWNKLIYSGSGEGPIRVQNEKEMIERIQKQPGSIGYVMTSEVFTNINIIQIVKEQ
jgi:ABC-type phosphate transport system substrate-binding protein